MKQKYPEYKKLDLTQIGNEINEYWDISPSLIYDLKESVYDSWSIGLTVGRRL